CTVALCREPFVDLFSESPGRALVAVRPENYDALATLCAKKDVPFYGLGTTGGTTLSVENVLEIPVAELHATYQAPLPAILDA
ncbi:MAG TPA: phosphoribosylformylglycinamidine synthase subunit PurL, partial [Thermopolyspora sp.]